MRLANVKDEVEGQQPDEADDSQPPDPPSNVHAPSTLRKVNDARLARRLRSYDRPVKARSRSRLEAESGTSTGSSKPARTRPSGVMILRARLCT